MALTIEEITEKIVKPALSEIADFDGPIEEYSTEHFQSGHISTFLTALKSNTNDVEVIYQGQPKPEYMYDIVLNNNIFSGWETLGDCINYIEQNQSIGART